MRIFFLILLTLQSASAARYFLSATGNDANDGLTPLTAWLTVAKATSTVVGGDIVNFPTNDASTYAAITLTESTDGSAGNYISYVGNGSTLLRAVVSGDYVRIIGFKITHASGTASGITAGGQFVELLNNTITNTGGVNIDPNGSADLIIRGNALAYPGSPGNNNGSGTKTIQDNADSVRVLIEYNTFSHCTDFVSPRGSDWIVGWNVLGPSSTNDFGGTPHVDGWQSNAQMRHGWMWRNWHINNSVSDAHMILIESPVDIPDANARSGYICVAQNVSLRSGDHLWFQMRDGFNLYNVQNIVGEIGYGPRGGPASSGFIYAWGETFDSKTNFSLGNIYWKVATTNGAVYTVSAGSDCTRSFDMVAPWSSDITSGSNGNLEYTNVVDLGFIDYAADNLFPTNTSPAVDTFTNLTTVDTGGTGTSFTVVDPHYFFDGFGLCAGMKIYVGSDNNLRVTDIDHDTRTITVSASFTCVSGENVGYAYRGSGADRGAFEYGDTKLTAATYSADGNNYTGTPTGDAEKFIFYQYGVPHTIDYDSPYTATIAGGSVTVEAFARHAQASPVVTATEASDAAAPGLKRRIKRNTP